MPAHGAAALWTRTQGTEPDTRTTAVRHVRAVAGGKAFLRFSKKLLVSSS